MQSNSAPIRDRFIREPECHVISGLSRTTRWRLEREGAFPKRRRISPNACAWLESEIMEWLRERAGHDAT
jgi:prophage regulatory protein